MSFREHSELKIVGNETRFRIFDRLEVMCLTKTISTQFWVSEVKNLGYEVTQLRLKFEQLDMKLVKIFLHACN